MCQYGGSLDYVVALDVNSGEIRVLRFTYEIAYDLATILDYKVVDKEEALKLIGNIYVDCKMTENYLGVNTYHIGIVGTYLQSNGVSS
jgi:hypothetical protein